MKSTETFLVIEYKGKFFSVKSNGFGGKKFGFTSNIEKAEKYSVKEFKLTDDVSEAMDSETSGRGAEKGHFVKYQIVKSYKKVA